MSPQTVLFWEKKYLLQRLLLKQVIANSSHASNSPFFCAHRKQPLCLSKCFLSLSGVSQQARRLRAQDEAGESAHKVKRLEPVKCWEEVGSKDYRRAPLVSSVGSGCSSLELLLSLLACFGARSGPDARRRDSGCRAAPGSACPEHRGEGEGKGVAGWR